MEKRKRNYLLLFVCVLVLCFNMGMSVSAQTRDVTQKYKSKVTKMLSPFDKYLCAPMAYNEATEKFVFNNYTKTSMIIYSPVITAYSNEDISSVKKKCIPKMKLYFGSESKFMLKKYRSYFHDHHLQYLFKNDHGKLAYTGGDYGFMDTPKGKVTRILQTSENKYTVTYEEYMTNDYYGYPRVYRGTYHVYLKKADNKFKFIITDIKMVKSVAWKH